MKKKVLLISAVVIVTIYVFTYFGGFTTGKSLDVNEFTMEEFFGNNWIEYKGVEYNA